MQTNSQSRPSEPKPNMTKTKYNFKPCTCVVCLYRPYKHVIARAAFCEKINKQLDETSKKVLNKAGKAQNFFSWSSAKQTLQGIANCSAPKTVIGVTKVANERYSPYLKLFGNASMWILMYCRCKMSPKMQILPSGISLFGRVCYLVKCVTSECSFHQLSKSV